MGKNTNLVIVGSIGFLRLPVISLRAPKTF
jgi:hypothetical protein